VLPDTEPQAANPYATVVIASGIGEARNAVIARAALCLVAIGDNFGTLSEVALGRQFGKLVVGLEGAAQVDGVVQVDSAAAALELVARWRAGGALSGDNRPARPGVGRGRSGRGGIDPVDEGKGWRLHDVQPDRRRRRRKRRRPRRWPTNCGCNESSLRGRTSSCAWRRLRSPQRAIATPTCTTLHRSVT